MQLDDKIELHESLKIKFFKNGTKKPIIETIEGEELYKTKNIWVNKKRIIDRENNEYFEEVKDNEDNLIHSCKEKLTDHFGHGSEKAKPTKI